MREVFDDSLGTTTIRSPRLSEQDLLQNLSDEGMNLVQLCMSARALQLEPFKNLLSGEKLERIALIKHITAKAEVDMLSCIDCRGMTVMHASSLLLLGCTAKRTLSAAELRSKRIKSYPSPELELLDAIRDRGVRHISSWHRCAVVTVIRNILLRLYCRQYLHFSIIATRSVANLSAL